MFDNQMSILDQLNQQIQLELDKTNLLDGIDIQVQLTNTPDNIEGDLGWHCGVLAKELKMAPNQIASHLAEQLNQQSGSDFIEQFIAVGPYLNLVLDKTRFSAEVVSRVLKQGKDFGTQTLGRNKKVVIDMSSPNIAKRMSVGHLRSTVIGDALANIYTCLGYEVIRDNHLGDWGTQFGHLLYAIELWGNEALIAQDPINELQKLYVKVSVAGDPQSDFYQNSEPGEAEQKAQQVKDAGREWFKRLEAGDEEARQKWQQIVDWSLADFNKIYDLLGVNFDLTLGESFYEPMLQATIQEVRSSGVAEESDGALIVDMDDIGLGVSIIEKSDGTTIYMTRDIATIKYRVDELHANKIIYVVGEDQAFYFRQLFEIVTRLGYAIADELQHVWFGMIRLPEGKMSTRKGRVVNLEDVIEEALSRSEKLVDERTRVEGEEAKQKLVKQIAIGAIKWADLSGDPKRTITFDWDKIISLDGNSAAYVQYAYARTQSILQKGNYNKSLREQNVQNLEYGLQVELDVTLLLAMYTHVIKQVAEENNPSLLANYIYDLARKYTAFYHSAQVLSSNVQQTKSRLALTDAFATTLQNGLSLLGIEVPQKM